MLLLERAKREHNSSYKTNTLILTPYIIFSYHPNISDRKSTSVLKEFSLLRSSHPPSYPRGEERSDLEENFRNFEKRKTRETM